MLTLLIYALALAVRLPGLFAPLWYDEIFSWWLTRLPAAEMAAAIAGDVHPPLFYYTLLFGAEPWQMRLLPLACSLAGLWVTMDLARWYFPAPSHGPRWVGLIYAISPFEVFYATELRMYAALQLVMLLMLSAIFVRRYWHAGAFGLLGVLLHHYGFIYVAAWGAVALYFESGFLRLAGQTLRGSVLATGKALAPLGLAMVALPFTGLLTQSQTVAAGYWMWPPTLADVLLLPGELLFSAPFGHAGLSALTIIGGVGALAVARGRLSTWPWLLAPAVLAFVVSWAWQPIFQHRPLVALAPLFYIALVAGFDKISQRRTKLFMAVVAAPMVLAALLLPNTRDHYLSRLQAPAILAAIGPLAPGATIYHTALYSRVEFEPFTPGVNNIIYPPPPGLGDGYSPQTRAALGIVEARPEDLTQPPDVVVIYRGVSYSPSAETAARHWVAAQSYRLIYTNTESETSQVWVFKIK